MVPNDELEQFHQGDVVFPLGGAIAYLQFKSQFFHIG